MEGGGEAGGAEAEEDERVRVQKVCAPQFIGSFLGEVRGESE